MVEIEDTSLLGWRLKTKVMNGEDDDDKFVMEVIDNYELLSINTSLYYSNKG